MIKNIYKIIRQLFITPLYQIYFLQLENYELRRFWRTLFKKGYFASAEPWRKQIDWTAKLLLIAILTAIKYILDAYLLYFVAGKFNFVWIILLLALFPVYLTISVIIIWPVDYFIKKIIIRKAKLKIKQFPNLKIIGIAGSYGKTTVKEMLAAAIGSQRKLLVTPENINTPLGISRLIISQLKSDTEIFIVEMGEYYRGDVKDICAITPPDISIVTGINEAHFERLKNISNTAATVFEVVEYSKSEAICVLNADDPNVLRYAPSFAHEHKVDWYGYRNQNNSNLKISGIKFNESTLEQSAAATLDGENFTIATKLLGSYAIGSAVAALVVIHILGLKLSTAVANIASLAPIKHRLEPIKAASGVLVIDDSYNGNPAGVKEAVELLSKFDRNRRRIFLTPGLVETGAETPRIHRQIGRDLATAVDLAILVKNSVTPFIAEGLINSGFAKDKIMWFNTALEAHANLKNILKPNDVILFQNDWGDNYL